MLQALDRYAPFTNLEALKEASSKPLRKCIRVNTLQCSCKEFERRAQEKGWQIEPVSWCKEGYFVETGPGNPIGKDLLHLLGHIYVQEASSMLPAALLDPQPGDDVLDMCAAPGSKTTQMAAKMEGKGVIVANDPQEKRLWTLKSAIHRSDVTNVLLTKKPGQWFSKHMTARFDKVLCDAPCTAQGTVRKDPDALKYASEDNIHKMSRIQEDLLEAAVHSTKIGGRIVYSTCTLCPEENEMVVAKILEKFSGLLEIEQSENLDMKQAIEDSIQLQQEFDGYTFETKDIPCLRIWPHAYDTEGFFCAVLKKTGPTRDIEKMEWIPQQEKLLKEKEQKAIQQQVQDMYGTSFLAEHERLYETTDQLMIATADIAKFRLSVQDFALGTPYANGLKNGRFRLTHDLATARGQLATQQSIDLTEEQKDDLLQAKDTKCDPALYGDIILRFDGLVIGMGLAKNGLLKNRISRWVVGQTVQ